MKDNTYSVYKHTCPNNKVYIGITHRKPSKRWGNGLSCYKHNKHFINAILKYGWDNIKHEILFSELSKEEAENKEIELIQYYNSTNRKYGYNTCSGGRVNKGFHISEKGKLAISKAQKGRKRTPEEIELMRKKLIGRKLTDKQKEKLKGRIPWNKGKKGLQKWTKSQREKMKNKDMSFCSKKVICVETNIIYNSLSKASKELNISQPNISRAIKNKTKCGGYHWMVVQ